MAAEGGEAHNRRGTFEAKRTLGALAVGGCCREREKLTKLLDKKITRICTVTTYHRAWRSRPLFLEVGKRKR